MMERLYRSFLEGPFRSVGLHEYLNDVYWKINLLPHNKFHTVRTSFLNCQYLRSEEFVIDDLYSELKDGDVFYDVGANIGQYTLLVLNHPSNIDVVSFEPYPDNFDELKYNVERNGFSKESRLYDVALHHTDGEIRMSGSDKKAKVVDRNTNTGNSIKARNGDEFISEKNIEAPTILKIDIEGGELNALKGLENTLKSKQLRLVYIEVHPDILNEKGQSASAVEKKLENSGFTLENIGSRSTQKFIKAKKFDVSPYI